MGVENEQMREFIAVTSPCNEYPGKPYFYKENWDL